MLSKRAKTHPLPEYVCTNQFEFLEICTLTFLSAYIMDSIRRRLKASGILLLKETNGMFTHNIS